MFINRSQAIKNPDALAKVLRVAITYLGYVMGRIVDGTWFERKRSNEVRLRATQTESGHIEVSAVRLWVEHEIGPVSYPVDYEHPQECDSAEDDALARAERALANAAQRARRNIRLACKTINANVLMTLTYKENVLDLAQCKSDLKEFVRRVRRVIPEFTAIAGFEQQKRGAWHVHLATLAVAPSLQTKGVVVKSYDLLRSIWRSVTKGNGGNVDISARKRHSRKTPARIASYLSKYLTKAFADGEKWSNRWTKFGQIAKPRSVDLGIVASMEEAIEIAFGMLNEFHSVVTSHVGAFGDIFFLAAEPRTGKG